MNMFFIALIPLFFGAVFAFVLAIAAGEASRREEEVLGEMFAQWERSQYGRPKLKAVRRD